MKKQHQNAITSDEIMKTIDKLRGNDLISSKDGTLKYGIKRKRDIVMYMIFLWNSNKDKMKDIGIKRVSMKSVNEMINLNKTKLLVNIIDDLNKRIIGDKLNIKIFDEFTTKDYTDMIYYLEDQLAHCKKNLSAYNTINIKPNVKFLTGDIVLPQDSVSVTFNSKRIMEK